MTTFADQLYASLRNYSTARADKMTEGVVPKNMSLGQRRTLVGYDWATSMGTAGWPTDMQVTEAMLALEVDVIYRVNLLAKGVQVICLGLEGVDSPVEGTYDDVHALPNWMQERIAILMMTKAEPPTHEVEGVGRRISERVFWVYAQNA